MYTLHIQNLGLVLNWGGGEATAKQTQTQAKAKANAKRTEKQGAKHRARQTKNEAPSFPSLEPEHMSHSHSHSTPTLTSISMKQLQTANANSNARFCILLGTYNAKCSCEHQLKPDNQIKGASPGTPNTSQQQQQQQRRDTPSLPPGSQTTSTLTLPPGSLGFVLEFGLTSATVRAISIAVAVSDPGPAASQLCSAPVCNVKYEYHMSTPNNLTTCACCFCGCLQHYCKSNPMAFCNSLTIIIFLKRWQWNRNTPF